LTGHSVSQRPQSIQMFLSITKKLYPSLKQLTGQTLTHCVYLQQMQFSVMTYDIFIFLLHKI
jgi:hypothetical protein